MKIIEQYIGEVLTQYNSGHAKEHAYRPALERLMTSFENVTAINDPKRSAYGNPDFVFLNKSNRDIILGYAEAKDIDISLDKTEKTEQMHRYGGYENLFLTNYIEFRFFQNGNKYQTIVIGELKNGKLKLNPAMFGQLADELAQFLALPPESIKSGKRLAQIMGAKARRIRDNVELYLAHEDDERNQELEKMYNMMKELLVHDLTTEKFADMYAQTLVYGLFVARFNDTTPENFDRKEARDLVPASNPFLREFFDHIVGPRFDKRLAYIVDELCEVFSVSDVNTLVHKHLKLFEVGDEKDPIIHFYEDFLKEYDPAERKKMGAYYTPLPVVRFIIKNVDEILKRDFGLPKGLADTSKKKVTLTSQGKNYKKEMHRVQILDPAVGTATFLNEVMRHIYQGFKGQEGRWPSYVETDLLPRIYGFELMMAPYTIAHLKLGMTLRETGVKTPKQRIGVYLTNTLEEGNPRQPDLFSFGLADVVSKEAEEAANIKHERPIMVIMGNPPYSLLSSNMGKAQKEMVQRYKYIDGVKIVEKGALQLEKNLNDDYVKFLAFAEDMITKNGEGIVAMITNNSYIENSTLRAMRYHLAQTFNQIYVLDLHGDTMKKDIAPDGGRDENVFQILKGVSIVFAIKTGKSTKLADVYHAEMFGLRKAKFDNLNSLVEEDEVKWSKVKLQEPNYCFVNKDWGLFEKYEKYISINELFMQSGAGIITARDAFILEDKADANKLVKRINDFASSQETNEELCNRLGIPLKKGWDVNSARASLKNRHITLGDLTLMSYRPFDDRLTFYEKSLVWSMSRPTMKHFVQHENIGLVVPKLIKESPGAFISKNIIAHKLFGAYDTNSLFPLYLYHDDGTRTANYKPEVLKIFTKNLKNTFEPEEILDYIYAVLHSPNYRETYKGFLKSDFPRVPVPRDDAQLKKLSALGAKLRDLHLMTSKELNDYVTTYPEAGSNEVEKISYKDQKVWINATQYFGNVPEVAWNFYIGGYQPAQKWLKDRKVRKLTNEDVEHYQKIIKTLIETDKLMAEIDIIARGI